MPLSLPGLPPLVPGTPGVLFSGGDQRLELGTTYPLPVMIFANNVLTDPQALGIEVQTPEGSFIQATLSASQLIRASVGYYIYQFTGTFTGRYAYTWVSSTPNCTCSGIITVRSLLT